MFWLVLCIALNVYIMLFFRIYSHKRDDVFPVLIWNYFFSSFCGWCIFILFYFGTDIKNPLIKNAIFLGAVFLLVFYLISLCTRYFGMSMASMFNKSGYILPLIFGYFYFSEKLGIYQWLGSILGICSLALAMWESKMENGNANYLIPLMVIIGSGSIDTIMMWNERMYFHEQGDAFIFCALIFSSAYLFGVILFIFKYPIRDFFNTHNVIYGALLGLPNYFSIFFLLMAIMNSPMQKSVLFGINNVSIVFASTIIGTVRFKEFKNKYQWLGIAGMLISMIMMYLK